MPTQRLNRRQMLAAAGATAFVEALQPVRRSPMEDLLAAVPEPNPYQRATLKSDGTVEGGFLKFWNELVWTKDESRAGEIRKAPAWPMFRDMEEDLMTDKLLLFDKSRRVMASWFVCAFNIWLMAGGQDPRWPALMRSRRNRQIVLASRKEKGFQGSAWFIESRVQFIEEELERRGIRERWPGWPTWTWNYCEGSNSMGSHIDGVPQGADQCRGPGATFLHFEEVAAWEQAQASIESAKMTLLSDEGYAGHLCCLTTAKVGTYAADVVLDNVGRKGWR